jgi:hypothetical protein
MVGIHLYNVMPEYFGTGAPQDAYEFGLLIIIGAGRNFSTAAIYIPLDDYGFYIRGAHINPLHIRKWQYIENTSFIDSRS